MRESYTEALSFVRRWEGGFVNHPSDRGGRTFAGISEAAHPDAWEDGVVTDDEISRIYFREYWLPIRGDALPAPLDRVVFDYAVHSGPGRAIRELQLIVGAAPDGIIGPRTLDAIKTHSPHLLAQALLARRAMRLFNIADRRPSQRVFLTGWLRRVSALEETLA